MELLFALLLVGGCRSHSFYDFMPTPNLYGDGPELAETLAQAPEPLQTEWAEVIYITDRVPGKPSDRGQEYGWERSRSAAFGTMRVHFGKDLDWDTLVERSLNGKRNRSMRVWAGDITEVARYPETPEAVDWDAPRPEVRDEVEATRQRADEALRRLVSQRLAQTPDKDVYLFIHGYNSEFEWGPYVIAQVWHFMGRTGVPMAYTWPAARPGLLRGYQYDRESGEFTVFHLKRFLKTLAACPGVEKVHIIAHSRGTDVTTTALRELLIEHGDPRAAREALKLGVLVLAAADLDAEVVTQRLTAEKVLAVPERFVFYVSEGDRAIGLSNWLFADERVGTIRPSDLREQGDPDAAEHAHPRSDRRPHPHAAHLQPFLFLRPPRGQLGPDPAAARRAPRRRGARTTARTRPHRVLDHQRRLPGRHTRVIKGLSRPAARCRSEGA